ncbi:MAG: HNH endonuclease [Candidatus Thorarchaeota archaeon]|jgi:hypothetical protein
MVDKLALRKGGRNTAFKEATKAINHQISKSQRQGRKTYYTRDDTRAAYDRSGGRCAYCGVPLVVRGWKRENSLRVMLYQPLKAGGKICRENLIAVCTHCEKRHGPLPKRSLERIPNVNTIADLIDRLIVEVHKLGWFENKKREEHAKENTDNDKVAEWDNLSRDCCEMRSILKRELNAAIAETVYTFQYAPKKEARTFRPPRQEEVNSIPDIISDMCERSARATIESEDIPEPTESEELKQDLVEALSELSLTKQYRILR